VFMACGWFDHPTREPLSRPQIVVGGTSLEDAFKRALEMAASFNRDAQLERIGTEWARAWRFTMRGEPAWPEQRKAKKAAADVEHAVWSAKWSAAEQEQKRSRPYAHLSDDELREKIQAYANTATRTFTDELHRLIAESMARRNAFYDSIFHGPKTAAAADAFTALGVPATASASDIKRAFRARALTEHPDHGGDPAVFRRTIEAYQSAMRAVGGGA